MQLGFEYLLSIFKDRSAQVYTQRSNESIRQEQQPSSLALFLALWQRMGPPSFDDLSSNTVIHYPENIAESPGPYDTLFHAICPQHPGKPRLDGPPRVPPSVRKHTPIRPVYDDFATAHLSITSGSAKAPSMAMLDKTSKKQRSLIQQGLSLSLRANKSIKLPKTYTQLDENPRMPTVARTAEQRLTSEFDFDITDAKFEVYPPSAYQLPTTHLSQAQPQKKASSAQFFSSLKKALSIKSSTSQKSNRTPFQSSFDWPKDSLELASVSHKTNQHASKETRYGRIASLHSWDVEEGGEIEREGSTKVPVDLHYLSTEDSTPPLNRDGGANQSLEMVSDDEGTASIFRSYDMEAELAGRGNENNHAEEGGWRCSTYRENSLRTTPHQPLSILQDCTTVDDIVNQYAGNDQLWNVRLESDDEHSDDDAYFQPTGSDNRVHEEVFGLVIPGIEHEAQRTHQSYMCAYQAAGVEHSTHDSKLIGLPGRALSKDLPMIPSIAGQQTVQSSSGDLVPSTLYGDTRNFLGITQHSGLVAGTENFQFNNIPSSDDPLLHSQSSFCRRQSLISSSVSFRVNETLPQSGEIQNGDLETLDGLEYMADSAAPQLALDREISRALHRMSGFSNFTQEMSDLNRGDGGLQSSINSGYLTNFIEKRDLPSADPQRPVIQNFYLKSAIRQAWLNSDGLDHLRIPIIRKGSASDSGSASSLEVSSADKLLKVAGRDESVNEWETILDAGVSSRGLMNTSVALDNFNRAGSSLANTSDDGSVGPQQYKRNDFSSTDRIIQHPAQIAYSPEYRYREMKEGKFPVLLPSYKQHTVNGFPANSFRSMNSFQRQADKYYRSPSPLERDHTNPFRSMPPEAISERQESFDSFEGDVSKNVISEEDVVVQPVDYDSDNWMDAFDGPGPSIKVDHRFDAINHPEHFSEGNSYSDSRTTGSSIADASSSTLGGAVRELEQLNSPPEKNCLKSNWESPSFDDRRLLPRERQPLIKGPPGAFYQGVRSQPESRRKVFSVDRNGNLKTPQRNTSLAYPTNQIRPLSLLKVPRTRPSTGANADQLEDGTEGDFPYRSPLAPIRSRTWRDLYTIEQLGVLRNNERRDRIHDLKSLPRQTSRRLFGNAIRTADSWRNLPCSPRIQTWPRENSSITTNASRKTRLSSIVFCLCCLFPPLLVLYGAGYLDNMMLWMTDGDIRSFKKAHKRLALQVVCFFIIATVVTVPVVVVLRVPHSKVS